MTQQELIADLAADMSAAVKVIESSTMTTQNHYGRYMRLIITASNGDKRVGRIIAAALLAAGANKRGVLDALRAAFGES